MCGEEKAAGAAGRIADQLAGPGCDAANHRLDQRARREVLAGAGLAVLRIALQQALVGVALHVGTHGRPVFGVDQVDDHAPQLGRILELVLRLTEDQRQRARLPAQRFQRVAVVVEQRIAIQGPQRGPRVGGRDGAGLAVRRAAALVRHLEEAGR